MDRRLMTPGCNSANPAVNRGVRSTRGKNPDPRRGSGKEFIQRLHKKRSPEAGQLIIAWPELSGLGYFSVVFAPIRTLPSKF
jgi:hypothetical protein